MALLWKVWLGLSLALPAFGYNAPIVECPPQRLPSAEAGNVHLIKAVVDEITATEGPVFSFTNPIEMSDVCNSNSLPAEDVACNCRQSGSFGGRKDPITGETARHKGVDIGAPKGTPIRAPADGIVVTRRTSADYGKILEIQHVPENEPIEFDPKKVCNLPITSGGGSNPSFLQNGIRIQKVDGTVENRAFVKSRFAHMKGFNATCGQRVKKGDIIGYVGNTGKSTGPHLHFEMVVDGPYKKAWVDPAEYIAFPGKSGVFDHFCPEEKP